MNYRISEQTNQHEWEAFLLGTRLPPFLQSWHMKALHERLGEGAMMVGIHEDDRLVGIACAIMVRAKRGHYLYLPYGPVCTEAGWNCFPELTAYLERRGKELSMDFIRSSPFVASSPLMAGRYADAGWKPSPIHMLAEHVWVLGLEPSEEELLKNMRKTMRNSIRRAERDGVTIRMSTDIKDVEHFIRIHKSTVTRHHFVPYPDDYFRAQVAAFKPGNHIRLFLAEFQGTVISAAIMMLYGDMTSYHHGASLSEYAKIPSSYLLQWRAIQEAKRAGCTRYNFWGIIPEEKYVSPVLKRRHPFVGVSTFKTGFGGERLDLLPCQDYALRPRYHMTRAIETIRKLKRGFF